MQRRYAGLLAAGVAVTMLVTLSSCGDAESADAGDDVHLTMVASDYGDPSGNSSQQYWDVLAGEFQLRNPNISIDVDVYGRGEADTKVASLVKKGEEPDLAQIGAYAEYAVKDKLYSANELLSIPVQAGFLPAIADAGKVSRVQYGLPFVASTRTLFYNKDLFEKAGIKGPPETWSELKADAEALKEADVKVPYALPLGEEEPQAETSNWILSGGGGYTDSNGGYTIDSPENIRTFGWLRDELVAEGLTNSSPGETDRQDAYEAFAGADVGMLNGHPTLMQLARENDIDFGIAPLPGRKGPSEAATGVADWMMAFKKNGHREAVGKFLDFVYSEENVLRLTEQYDLLPVTSTAFDAMRADRSRRELWEFLDQLQTAEFYPVDKVSWGPTVRRIKSAIGGAVLRYGDPRSVLTGLQREAETLENSAR